MYYFDRDFLGEYLDLKVPIKVYVHNQWYDIADSADLEDSEYGIGYDQNGKSETFDYREIEEIDAAGKHLTVDQLQDVMAGKVDSEDGGEESGDSEPDMDLGGKGSDMEFPSPDGAGEGGDSEPTPEDSTEIEPDEKGKKESYYSRKYIKHKLNEQAARINYLKGKGIGNIIQNTNPDSEYCGTSGIITDIFENVNNLGIDIYEYRIVVSTRRSDFGKTVYIENVPGNIKIM
jgi:hypothetical protein